METLFVSGIYVYVGENSPSRKGVSLCRGTEYNVYVMKIEDVWYGFITGEDGYMTRHPLKDFKTIAEIRREIIDDVLKHI